MARTSPPTTSGKRPGMGCAVLGFTATSEPRALVDGAIRLNEPPMYNVSSTRAAVFTVPLITKLTREFDDGGWASACGAAIAHKTPIPNARTSGRTNLYACIGEAPREADVFGNATTGAKWGQDSGHCLWGRLAGDQPSGKTKTRLLWR